VSPRCTRKRMVHRVGPSGYYSSTLSTGSRTRSERRGCSENYKASSRRAKKRWTWLALILTVLLVVGVTAVFLSRAVIFPDASSATNATGEEAQFSSKSSISELPRTGGPKMHT
jgi:cytoskeletal protein RodZ